MQPNAKSSWYVRIISILNIFLRAFLLLAVRLWMVWCQCSRWYVDFSFNINHRFKFCNCPEVLGRRGAGIARLIQWNCCRHPNRSFSNRFYRVQHEKWMLLKHEIDCKFFFFFVGSHNFFAVSIGDGFFLFSFFHFFFIDRFHIESIEKDCRSKWNWLRCCRAFYTWESIFTFSALSDLIYIR